jgi:ornithine cyclodeaminase
LNERLVLSDSDIRTALPLTAAVESQKSAYRAAVTPGGHIGSGTSHAGASVDSLVFALTGSLVGKTGVACKFGMQVPDNRGRGLPSVHAFVTLIDADTGETLACLNGTTITTMRTAAGIAAAADVWLCRGRSDLA